MIKSIKGLIMNDGSSGINKIETEPINNSQKNPVITKSNSAKNFENFFIIGCLLNYNNY